MHFRVDGADGKWRTRYGFLLDSLCERGRGEKRPHADETRENGGEADKRQGNGARTDNAAMKRLIALRPISSCTSGTKSSHPPPPSPPPSPHLGSQEHPKHPHAAAAAAAAAAHLGTGTEVTSSGQAALHLSVT